MKKSIIVTLLLFVLVGCSSFSYVEGIKISQQSLSSFQEGKTMSTELIEALGAPGNISKTTAGEIWVYSYIKINPFPFPNEAETTSFIFNKKGILKKIVQSSGSTSQNPLLRK